MKSENLHWGLRHNYTFFISLLAHKCTNKEGAMFGPPPSGRSVTERRYYRPTKRPIIAGHGLSYYRLMDPGAAERIKKDHGSYPTQAGQLGHFESIVSWVI